MSSDEGTLFPVQRVAADSATAVERAFVVNEKTLISLALLQVNWDEGKRSYLDNFVPFAVEAMRRSGAADYSNVEVAAAIEEQFGVRLPVSVVGTLLSRVPRDMGARLPNARFGLTDKALDGVTSLLQQEARVGREQRNLAESLQAFAESDFDVEWSVERAESVLLDYVEGNATTLLGSALRGVAAAQFGAGDVTEQFIAAAWIGSITTGDPQRFDYLLTLVKGSMLAAAVFHRGGLEQERRFRGTRLVLDTPVLLKALGYEGVDARDMVRETLSLARAQDAELVCFDKSVSEARGVLWSAAASLRSPYRHVTPMSAVARYFGEEGRSSRDVDRLAESLDVDLSRLHIAVIAQPDHIAHQTVDEEALRESLQKHVRYSYDKALLHDLDALTAVHRMRGKSGGDRIETCRAVLVTTNASVVRAAVSFPDFREHGWPVATLLDDLATILWVKQPLKAPELPRYRLMAACVTVLSPSDALWDKYLQEVERLRTDDRISDADVAILRHSQESRLALMRETMGRQTDVDETLIRTVLEQAQARYAAPIENQLELVQVQAEEAEEAHTDTVNGLHAELAATHEKVEDLTAQALKLRQRDDDVRERVERQGRGLGQAIRWVVVAAVVGVVVASAVGSGPAWLRTLGLAIGALAALVGGFTSAGKPIQDRVAHAWASRRKRALGLE